VVLCLHDHDVLVLVEDVLPKHLEVEVLLAIGSLISSYHLFPGALGEVQGSRKQAVWSSLEVLMGITH
jgi:hypothetical protein